jgi:hypothetical protein
MDPTLDQISILLKNNIFLTPELRNEIWNRVREVSPERQQLALTNLQEIDGLQRSMIRKILEKSPGFFKNIARESTQKRIHLYLQKERNEHEKELSQMDQLLEETISEL